jgi:hypothetical protein
MIVKLGWENNDNDKKYCESRAIRDLNEQSLLEGKFLSDEAPKILEALTQPWVIKDPRFRLTLNQWKPHLRPYKPTLILLHKSSLLVQKSFQRRNANWVNVPRRQKQCITAFNGWPFDKILLEVSKFETMLGMYNLERSRGVIYEQIPIEEETKTDEEM